MIVYRIAKTKYINDFSGSGARLYGGRWNHKGVGIIYTSGTRSLATVEYLVHVLPPPYFQVPSPDPVPPRKTRFLLHLNPPSKFRKFDEDCCVMESCELRGKTSNPDSGGFFFFNSQPAARNPQQFPSNFYKFDGGFRIFFLLPS